MAETIILDPSEVATSRTQLNITPWVSGDGIDWGDAEIAAYMADQARGSSPVDFRVPNRTVSIPLVVKTVGGTTFATARTNIQAKAALFQREGGWIKRLTSSGGTVFADVVNATLKLSGGWGQAHKNYDTDASLVVETLPDFYGSELTLADHSTTTASELVFTETGIQGDYPARTRIVVDEDDGDRQRGLIWGVRSRTYDAAATAQLAYNGGTLTPRDVATVSGTSMRHSTITPNWTPILSTDIVPTGPLTHVGTYRVWATVTCAATLDPELDVRFLWDVGDLSNPVENTPTRLPGVLSSVYTIDLGEIRIDRAPSGTHRWQGQIQARSVTPPGAFDVKRVSFVPVDEGYGVLSAPVNSNISFNSFTVRDEFGGTASPLHGRTVQVGGGTWSTFANGSAAVDFQVTGSGAVTRTAVSETGWRGALAGTATLTDSVTHLDFNWATTDVVSDEPLILYSRRINQDNFVGLQVVPRTGAVVLARWTTFSGASENNSYLDTANVGALVGDSWYTIRLYVDTGGVVAGWVTLRGSQFGLPIVSARLTDAATGGALASGATGFIEKYTSATVNTRTYENLLAYPPAVDAVLHPSQSVELRWDGMYREDSTGAAYGPVPVVVGSLLRLPPAGLEARTCEVFLKGSRGDYGLLPDFAIDDISARVFYRPCWLFVP